MQKSGVDVFKQIKFLRFKGLKINYSVKIPEIFVFTSKPQKGIWGYELFLCLVVRV